MTEENWETETPKNETGDDQPNDQDESTEEKDPLKDYDQQRIRAEKAESETKKLKAQLAQKEEKSETSETPKNEEQSNKSDDRIDKLTLKSEGISNADDQAMVIKEATRLKMSVEEVMGEDHIKSRLKKLATQRDAEAGMPDESGKPSGGVKGSVDYWMDKKVSPNSEELALPKDRKLKLEVINARMDKERRKREFPDE
jgi:hypothetical protein|tara:strand:+ start:1962 stop:2558 length:597 start_codon:yes stop_codon:yes gene_type:complete